MCFIYFSKYVFINGKIIYDQDVKEEINMLKQEIEILQKGLRFVSIIFIVLLV